MARSNLFVFALTILSLGSTCTSLSMADIGKLRPMRASRLPIKRQGNVVAAAPTMSLASTVALPTALGLRGGADLAAMASTVVPKAGVLIANALFAAGIPAILAARRNGSLGPLNAIPFVMVLGNCGAWIAYGLVVANPYVFWANAPGFLCGLFMFSSSVKLCDTPKDRNVLEGLALGFGAVLLATAYTTSMVLTTQAARANLCVAVANAFTFAFYASPLSSMGTVFKAKNSASLSLPLLGMSLTNSALWTSYGLSIADKGLVVPNGAGVILSVLQLAVFFAFRQPSASATKATA